MRRTFFEIVTGTHNDEAAQQEQECQTEFDAAKDRVFGSIRRLTEVVDRCAVQQQQRVAIRR